MHERLKKFRLIAGMTQQQLADALAYERSHYASIESGKRSMPDVFYPRAISKMIKHTQEATKVLQNELIRL